MRSSVADIFYGFQTQARSHETIFGDRALNFVVNVTHWWDIENQNFGGDPMTLPFLRFFKNKGGSHERYVQKGRWNPASPTHVLTSLAEAKCQLNQIFGKTTLEAI